MSWPNDLLLTFIPLFIAIDAIGVVLYLIEAGNQLSRKEHDRIAGVAVLTAGIVGLVFLFLGRLILGAMNISIGSFAIAGGIVLIVLAIGDLVTGQKIVLEKEALIAVVPLGTPLLAGPAMITALLLLSNQYPIYIVLVSFVLNLLAAWAIFAGRNAIFRFMGRGGIRAVSNIFNLLLAAIAVSYILKGLTLLGILH